MRERPILFSAPMVRALLAGTKTQTRRALKPQPVVPEGAKICCYDETATYMSQTRGWQVEKPGEYEGSNVVGHLTDDRRQLNIGKMPFCAGDRLWVRESVAYDAEWGHRWADGTYLCEVFGDAYSTDALLPDRGIPSIHVPRRYSRITLEITAVRVERLQDISEADSTAEGCKNSLHLQGGRFANENFAHLWWTINGDGSWEANAWAWVVEFKRITP